jgi:hypothetical protein
VAAQAFAVDAMSQSTVGKRQAIALVTGCMTKRMSANRAVSYNEAMKVCKAQLNKQIDNSASGTLVASATPAKL